MKLNKAKLLEFQRRTQYIKPNQTQPILSNLKLDIIGGELFLTKNSLIAACVMLIGKANEPDMTLLLDDRIFTSFVSATKAEEVDLTWDADNVTLTDKKTVVNFQRLDPTDYPKTPSYHNTETNFKFTDEHLAALNVAKNFTNDNETAGNFLFVHIGGDYISAFHNNYFYLSNKFTGLPEILLDKSRCDIICGVGAELEFGQTGNHYFFLAGDSIFIFTKQEGKTGPIAKYHERLAMPGKDFTIEKEELFGFVNIANMVSEMPMVNCTMKPKGALASLELIDANHARSANREVMITGTFDQFNFDARLLATPLKAIPYEELKAKTNQNNLIINSPDEKEYFCFVGLAF